MPEKPRSDRAFPVPGGQTERFHVQEPSHCNRHRTDCAARGAQHEGPRRGDSKTATFRNCQDHGPEKASGLDHFQIRGSRRGESQNFRYG